MLHTEEGYITFSGATPTYHYYLKDHQGNNRVVMNQSGTVEQVNHYYPFGGLFGEGLQTSNQPYKYNGKELDRFEGLDLFDYGARHYDAAVGRWGTIDRFAEKYASLTPYHYAANNPIYYIDVNGDSLWITHNTGFLGLGGKQTLLYENGSLYNKDGSSYTGKVKGFLSKSVNALNTISGTQEGGSMVGELQSSANNFTLVKGDSKFTASNATKAYANQIQTDPAQAGTFQALQNAGVNLAGGSGGTISWNPSGATLPTLNGSGVNGTTDLAHEMFHGLDANRGLLDNRVDQGIERSEWQAVYRENVLRSQLGSPLRTHYIKTVDANGIFLGGSGTRMLTPANQPILPNWYTP
ncbi:MAG: M91 family zinc metallopeptidase [Dysgonamonadaceae bacterium]|nr:M91 family zinc metallopeptidase [Dysgonamonadaceae bacterium]